MAGKSNFIVRGGLDMSAITTGLAKTQKQLTSFQSQTSKTMSALSGGLKMALGYVSVRAIAGFVQSTTKLASDLTEVQNVVDVAFGDMSYKMEKFASTSIRTFGISSLEAKKTGSSYMAMAKGMKLSSEIASNMSLSLTGLSADMASFYNISQGESRTALSAVFTGETETLKRYGILITEINLQEYARQQGITKSIAKMTQQEKVMLRYNYVMDATTLAQGDFARTSMSWANQTRVLSQQFKVLGGTIGAGFINVLTPTLSGINEIIGKLQVAAEYFKQFTALLFGNGNITGSGTVSELTDETASATDNLENLGDAGVAAGNKIKKSFAGIDEITTIGDTSSSSSSGNIGSETDTATNDTITTDSNISVISSKVQEMVDKVKPQLEKLKELFDNIKPAIAGVAAAFATYSIITTFEKLAGAIGALSLTPAGIVAIAIGALAAIVFAIIQHRKDLAAEDLGERFGDIALSIEEVGEMAQKITDTKYSANLEVYITEKAKLDELEGNIQTDIDALNKLNWKISVGIGLTPSEVSQYDTTIKKFITDSEAYMEQQQYVANLAIDAVIQDDSNFNAEIKDMVNKYFDGSKSSMAQLGKDLRSEMDKALADGVIDSTEQKTINNLVKEIAEINSQIANAEFKAKLNSITVEGDLTPDSFKDLTEKIQEIIGERIKTAEEASVTVRTVVEAQYAIDMKNATTKAERDKIQKDYDADIKELTKELSQTKANISLDGTEFSLDSLLSKYNTELSRVGVTVQEKTKTTFTAEVVTGITNSDPSEGIQALVDGLEYNYLTAMDESELSTATKDGLKEMLKGLEPSAEQYKKIYDDAIKTGSQVPDGISAQLTDVSKLQALTGDRDAILFLIGQQMAESPEYLNMIAASKTAGTDLDEGIIAGLKSKIPDLQLQGERLVFNVGKAIKDKSEAYETDNMPRYANKLIDGYKSKFDTDGTAVLSVRGWLSKIASEISGYKLPSLSTQLLLNVSGIDTKDPLGILSGIQTKANGGIIKKYAAGGIPDMGQLFIAREAGNELVGRIGNNSAVANNDQIVEAVSIGVANAVSSVMGSRGNTGGDTIIYIGEEEIARAVTKGQSSLDRRNNPTVQFV